MKIKKMIGNKYALIIEKDEMIIKTLEQFAIKENIGMAQFQMIGAITNVTLGYIPKKSTDYVKKLFLNNMNCYQQLEQSFEMKKIEINQVMKKYHKLLIIKVIFIFEIYLNFKIFLMNQILLIIL
ncbi:MAG: hypothetical protein H9Q65_00145 [Spiroplasma ixodetis]|nr:hypothetical protein [Spiroplasma ixodetis]MBP1527657.1 hypothetical protein [Spiroplasma ixodetis]